MNDDTCSQPPLFSPSDPTSIFVNPLCTIYVEDRMCVVVLNGVPIVRYHSDDICARDLFIAQAQEAGYAKGSELAEAFGLTRRTIYRIHQRYKIGGVRGLEHKRPGPKGPRLGEAREAAIVGWSKEGRTVYWMAKRLRISMDTVRRALIRHGLPTRRVTATQQALLEVGEVAARAEDDAAVDGGETGGLTDAGDTTPDATTTAAISNDSEGAASSGTLPQAFQMAGVSRHEERAGPDLAVVAQQLRDMAVLDPDDRVLDRVLASRGLLDDALPVFGARRNVPRAGVLLAVPPLVESGVFEVAHEVYGTIGPAFYGLRTILLTMMLMALLRIKNPENIMEVAPHELGMILGLDRAPEVKTIRRKLSHLAADPAKAAALRSGLAARHAGRAQDAMGLLYVDGHLRVYHGRADIPKAHVARMRLALSATQDVWVNDSNGDPVFLVTQPPHSQLVSALPGVLGEVRRLVGDRRVTVVFDRGGWSPELFRRMDRDGFDVLTYRKGKLQQIPAHEFTPHEVMLPRGQVTYELSDRPIVVGDGFSMRQVTRRQGDHQTHVITTRRDLPAAEIAQRMFDRWRQENFFKYMRQQFALDALVEYGTESDDPDRLVLNPQRQEKETALAKAKLELADLENKYARACAEGLDRETVRVPGFKPVYGLSLLKPLAEARQRVRDLKDARTALPRRVRAADVKPTPVRLLTKRRQITDALKMLAYQAETDLARAIAPHFRRSLDEGRSLIRSALLSTADIEPVDDQLRITLAPLSTPGRTRAVRALCHHLNETRTAFPGTELRLRYAVRAARDDT